MAKQTVGLGSSANDGTGDTLRSGGTKVNANFDEIYAEFGDGSALSNGNTSGHILVANGTKFGNVAASGDISIANTGVVAVTDVSLTTNTLGGTAGVGGFEIPQGSAPSTTTNKLYNVGNTLYWHGTAVGVAGGSAISAFNVTGDSGTAQSIADGNTITIAGGTGIASVASATDTITLNIDSTVATLVGTQTFTNKTIDADGTGNSITNIENANIKAAAAIAVNKLAATTVSRALVSDGSGFVSAATTTATEIGYVNGVTSAIQTQITAKQPTISASARIDAAHVHDGSITNTEYGYLNGVTSAIQTQITAKHTSGASLDMNGTELILDVDADTSITASTDDQIDIRIGGTDLITLTTGLIDVKNSGTASAIRLYCESSNAHYVQLQSGAHSGYGGNVSVTLPTIAGTIALSSNVLTPSSDTQTATSGNMNVTTTTSFINSTSGAQAIALPNGTVGQIKHLIMITDGGDSVITPATFANGSTLTFADQHDAVTLIYTANGWNLIANNGATLA